MPTKRRAYCCSILCVPPEASAVATGSADAAATEDTAAEYISTEDTREVRCIETTLHLAEEAPVEESEVLEAVEDFEPTEATVDDNAAEKPTETTVTEREAVVPSDAVPEDVVTEDLTTKNFANEDLASEFVEDHVTWSPQWRPSLLLLIL